MSAPMPAITARNGSPSAQRGDGHRRRRGPRGRPAIDGHAEPLDERPAPRPRAGRWRAGADDGDRLPVGRLAASLPRPGLPRREQAAGDGRRRAAPRPPCSTTTAIATCGSSAGAKPMNHECGSPVPPSSAVPDLPATVRPLTWAPVVNGHAEIAVHGLDHGRGDLVARSGPGGSVATPPATIVVRARLAGRTRARGAAA